MKLLLFSILLLSIQQVTAMNYIYREITGSNSDLVYVTVLPNEVTVKNNDGVTRIFNAATVTDSCCFYRSQTGVVLAEQNGTTLAFTEDSVTVQKNIGSYAWYQSLYNLKEFLDSGKREQLFCRITSEFEVPLSQNSDIEIMKCVFKRKGEEILDVLGSRCKTIKVIVTFPDARSLFWKSTYWYRKSDGILVKAEETRGGPGTKPTEVLLVDRKL